MSETGEHQCRRRRSLTLYALLVLCRLLLAPVLPGYVHPDEFFQGGQELWYGCPPFVPWEFSSQHALRSVVPPTLMTGLPLRLYAWVLGRQSFSGMEILVIPRLFCTFLSIITVDVSLWSLCSIAGTSRHQVPTPVLLAASAWPTWVLLSRPFTNALETCILALLLLVVLQHRWDFLMGALSAMGVFTRFTFVGFALPAVIRYLIHKNKTRNGMQALRELLWALSGFLVTSGFFVFSDATFYSEKATNSTSMRFLTPLNAFRYNSRAENLQGHGLHPHWTHSLVNMFLLFGPLTILFYIYLVRTVILRKSDTSLYFSKPTHQTCYWTVLSGLGFLSLAPHQEPRFLLPLLVPLSILVSADLVPRKAWRRMVAPWIVFNLILLLVFGVLHQGGLVPALLASTRFLVGNSNTLVVYRTYMPPTFVMQNGTPARCIVPGNDLAGQTCRESIQVASSDSSCGDYVVIDLKDSDVSTLKSTLADLLRCFDNEQLHGLVYLVAPTLEQLHGIRLRRKECFLGDAFTCTTVWNYFPHLSTEDPPSFSGSMYNWVQSHALGIYEVSCSQRRGYKS